MANDKFPLRVFMCHSNDDKPVIRALYKKLIGFGVAPWLDEEELLPGQDWKTEIDKAVQKADVIIVFLSNQAVSKEGYVQKEIRLALDVAQEKAEGEIFLIPAKIEACEIPSHLSHLQCVNLYQLKGEEMLFRSLQLRAASRGIEIKKNFLEKERQAVTSALFKSIEFVRVTEGEFHMGSVEGNPLSNDFEHPQHTVDIPYPYWIMKFPITNILYNDYVNAKGMKHPVPEWKFKKGHPVTQVSWHDAIEYCIWFNDFVNGRFRTGWEFRLPTEAEWEKAARGIDGREYPWGNEFSKSNCNVLESLNCNTVAVEQYVPEGDSPYGCANMAGNVWEWTHSLWKDYPYAINDERENGDQEAKGSFRVLRGGSFQSLGKYARCAYRNKSFSKEKKDIYGFRILAEFRGLGDNLLIR